MMGGTDGGGDGRISPGDDGASGINGAPGRVGAKLQAVTPSIKSMLSACKNLMARRPSQTSRGRCSQRNGAAILRY